MSNNLVSFLKTIQKSDLIAVARNLGADPDPNDNKDVILIQVVALLNGAPDFSAVANYVSSDIDADKKSMESFLSSRISALFPPSRPKSPIGSFLNPQIVVQPSPTDPALVNLLSEIVSTQKTLVSLQPTPSTHKYDDKFVKRVLYLSKLWDGQPSDDLKCLDFIDEFEEQASAYNAPWSQQLIAIRNILKNSALNWFLMCRPDLTDFVKFKVEFLKAFLPPNFVSHLRSKIREQKQMREERLLDFYARLHRLNVKLPSKDRFEQKDIDELVLEHCLDHYKIYFDLQKATTKDSLLETATLVEKNSKYLQASQPSLKPHQPQQKYQASHKLMATRQPDTCTCENAELEEPETQLAVMKPQVGKPKEVSKPRSETSGPSQPKALAVSSASRQCFNCKSNLHLFSACPEPINLHCHGCGLPGKTIRTCEKCRGTGSSSSVSKTSVSKNL